METLRLGPSPVLVEAEDTPPGLMNLQLTEVAVYCTVLEGEDQTEVGVHWISAFTFTAEKPRRFVDCAALSLNMREPRAHVLSDKDIEPRTTSSHVNTAIRGNRIGTLETEVRPPAKTSSTRGERQVPRKVFALRSNSVTGSLLMTAVKDKGFHWYRFADVPRGGCLHWQLQLLKMLEERRWIDEGSAEALLAHISAAHEKLSQRDQRNMILPPPIGIFYRPKGAALES